MSEGPRNKSPHVDPAADAQLLDTLDPRVADTLRLILRIAGGDFSARGETSERSDAIDAIVVGLNMLAESFEHERLLRDRAETLLADAVDSYENAPGLFCSIDARTHAIVKCNQTFADAVGSTKLALEGRSLLALCEPASQAELRRALRAISNARPLRMLDVELATVHDQPLIVRLSGSVMYDAERRPLRLRLSLQDVTAERRLESQLLHAQKMEAIGQLAGGVAHDFNNLLLVIQTASTMLARSLLESPTHRQLIGQVQDAAGRAAALTRQLLTFARREPTRPAVVDIASLMSRNEAMLARLLGPSIALEVRAQANNARVRIDPSRLEQALMNLVINARDAMPSGGRLTLQLDEAALERAPKPGAMPVIEPCVRLSITDTGLGIALENRSRIFEPFFTTKPAGSGTGLGLAMVYGIVTQAGGEVRVESEMGRGTRFELYLPRATSETQLPRMTDPVQPARGGSETLLLVEDDRNVRMLTASLLVEAGYHVHEAESAEHALALDAAVLDAVALVISDVVMPGMPGTTLVETLCSARPKLRCVLMSGYPAEHRLGAHWFLPKPFSPDQLLRLVRERLDSNE
jgi:signal transduction histidine kinase/CheY-like chemotaxis protein